MSETTDTPAPVPAPSASSTPPPPPPPGPAQQSGSTSNEASYTATELQAEAAALGCYPWDVPAVFAMRGVSQMTEEQFKDALQEWRTPPTEPAPDANEGGF